MRKTKVFGGILAAVVVLAAGLLLAVYLLVNPNNYKDRIIAAVKQSTGRELTLEGDIKLSVFPFIALELGAARLGNPQGFGDQPFLSITHAAVRVKLLPLLKQQLEIARIECDGLDVRLVKNAQGRGNWQSAERERPVPNPGSAGHGLSETLAALSNVRIQHGRMSYADTLIENFALETGSVDGSQDVPFKISFDARSGTPATEVTVSASFNLSLTPAGTMNFAAVNLSGTVNRPGDGRPTHWDVSVPALALDVDRQTLGAPAFSASYSSAHVSGGVQVTQLTEDVQARGALSLSPLVLQEFAPRLGVSLPKTRDPKVLSALSGGFNFSYTAAGVALDQVQLKLDDSNLKGNLKLSGGATPALKFDLALDAIDLDRYRTPNGAAAAPQAAKASATADVKTHVLEADGTFTLGAAQVAGMELANLRVVVASHDGVTRLSPIDAALDGGRFSADVTVDQRAAIPTCSVDEHLTGVDMAKLLAKSAEKGRLSGRANVALKILAQGTASDELMKTLNGHLEASITEGALEGVDLAFMVGEATALVDRQAPAPPANTKRTQFDAIKMSADIVNGVATTKDLTISSAAFKLVGQGSARLPTKGLDLNVTASLFKGNTTLVDIPMKVTGTYTDPKVKPNLEALAKSQVKQKLQDVLKKNGLEGLFK